MTRRLAGEMLFEMGLVSREDLQQALELSHKQSRRLGEVLVSQGWITEHDLAKVLAAQFNCQFLDLRDARFHPDAVKLVPETVARKVKAVPISVTDDSFTVAMADPLNVVALNELSFLTNRELRLVVMAESDIEKAIDRVYIRDEDTGPQRTVTDAPVVRLVETIFSQAAQEEASDVHIEPREDLTRLRYRIDGVLVDINQIDKELHPAIVSRIKVLAGMDISERRIPQDGSIRYNVDGTAFDMRISTMPTVAGEKVVVRLLKQTSGVSTLEDLGMAPDTRETFDSMLKKPYGMILVCGPTGSGKSTTLQIALQILNSSERNIITMEDPVEYRVVGVNQVQINPRAKLTFASALRSVVRQDPDVIMVGEIRDLETADMAVRSALTGHLVLSTVHTNDAPGAITRLVDMGVEPYLVASSVVGVLAQRLVRKICEHCAVSYELGPHHPEVLSLGLEPTTHTLRKGTGCSRCHNTGYRGRVGIFEIFPITDELREFIVNRSSTNVLRREALSAGMRSLASDGVMKVRDGITTAVEVLRATMMDNNV